MRNEALVEQLEREDRILSTPCPRCGAPPGLRCTNIITQQGLGSHHFARRRAYLAAKEDQA